MATVVVFPISYRPTLVIKNMIVSFFDLPPSAIPQFIVPDPIINNLDLVKKRRGRLQFLLLRICSPNQSQKIAMARNGPSYRRDGTKWATHRVAMTRDGLCGSSNGVTFTQKILPIEYASVVTMTAFEQWIKLL